MKSYILFDWNNKLINCYLKLLYPSLMNKNEGIVFSTAIPKSAIARFRRKKFGTVRIPRWPINELKLN